MPFRRIAAAFALLLLCGALSTPAPGQAPDKKEKFKPTDDEQTILDMTNEARKKEKLPPLKVNAVLFKVARAHSQNMAKQGLMEHTLDDKTPADRVKAAGYKYGSMAENIAAGERWELSTVFEAWMDSPHHRDNILKKGIEEIGIGIHQADNGKVYYTQVFGKPLRTR